jgi:hypothetical protein
MHTMHTWCRVVRAKKCCEVPVPIRTKATGPWPAKPTPCISINRQMLDRTLFDPKHVIDQRRRVSSPYYERHVFAQATSWSFR